MFFGTIEVAWSSSKDVISWGHGIKDNLWSKNKHKNRQLFDLGFEQVPPATYTCKKLPEACSHPGLVLWYCELPAPSPSRLSNEYQILMFASINMQSLALNLPGDHVT